MQVTQGSLVMVGLNTPNAKVFWNGKEVVGITRVRVDWELDEQRVKLHVNGEDTVVYEEMISSGIIVKKDR